MRIAESCGKGHIRRHCAIGPWPHFLLPMQLESYLRHKTRQPQFVWRVTIGILVVGVLIAYGVQASPDADVDLAEWIPDGYGEHMSRLEQLASSSKWAELWWAIPRAMWLGVVPGPTVLALVAGASWFAFLLQSGQPWRSGGIRWPLAVAGLILGVASIWPTLFAIFWQEQVMDLRETNELAGGLKFFILGVGFREELSKLLLFFPLVPWIVRRGSEREALLVAACVGLGFAMEENVSYFFSNAGSSAGRFLTANFMHMSLTGLVGLAVCRGFWQPRQRAGEAIAIVLLAIVAHGMYDAMIVLPALEQYSMVSYIITILLAYQFFHELRTWWQPPGETISLTATFLVAVGLVVASTVVYLSSILGLNDAIRAAVIPAVSLGIVVYLFLREMPESIIDV